MWRSNYYHEDWERRKTYLIRSLFQDIPVLSPVPESEESRHGAVSPSDVPQTRPYSPLPPLIIERLPNKHDDPPQYYRELESKVKKVYKKLFLDEGNSSTDDLIEMYAGNIIANASVSTVKLHERRSQDQSSLGQVSPEQVNYYENANNSRSNSFSSPSKADSLNYLHMSSGVQSSTQSLGPSQVVTVVEVHKERSDHDDDTLQSLCIDRSPVLECRQIAYTKTLSQNKWCQEEKVDKDLEDYGSHEISGTETSGSPKEDSEESERGEETEQVSSSETSHKSIELMRRQRKISASLGSLQNEAITSLSSRRSSCRVELQANISLDLPDENNSSDFQQRSKQGSISSATLDFQNILTTSTPKCVEESETKSSAASRGTSTGKRSKSDCSNASDETHPLMVTKRRKYENIAIQTSFKSESDVDDSFDWNQLKNNFFVGIPKIYKLCPCVDHNCRINNC